MNQPPGSLLSSAAVATYGAAIRALRRFTQGSLNKEPEWRRRIPDESADADSKNKL
jgi:hydrogenase small subunit